MFTYYRTKSFVVKKSFVKLLLSLLLNLISPGEHAAAGARLAGEEAFAGFLRGVDRHAAGRHFQLFQLGLHFRSVDEMAVR